MLNLMHFNVQLKAYLVKIAYVTLLGSTFFFHFEEKIIVNLIMLIAAIRIHLLIFKDYLVF